MWKSISRRLSECGLLKNPRAPVVAIFVAALGLGGGAGVLLFDLSQSLTRDEVERLKVFADRTGSDSVRQAFVTAAANGSVTTKEAWRVIEAAKAQRPGRGLLSD